MATGDKIFIADKQTLDDVHSKIGSTGNTGGSVSAGSIFGKLNAIISSITTFVGNWTAARAAKVDNLDAKVSTRQSETDAASRYNQLNTNTGVNNTASATGTLSQKLSHAINTAASRQSEADAASRYNQLNANTAVNNAASATGTLSQKLSHIIGLFTTVKQKTLVSKAVKLSIESAGTHTLVNVTGGGQLEFVFTDLGDSANPITFEIDGIAHVLNTFGQGVPRYSIYVGQSTNAPGSLFFQSGISYKAEDFGATLRPIYFKNSLKITAITKDTTYHSFAANYAVYE